MINSSVSFHLNGIKKISQTLISTVSTFCSFNEYDILVHVNAGIPNIQCFHMIKKIR